MSDLRPCPQCRRHVRIAEPKCPFCAAELELAPARPLPVGRLTRAAVFAGAALASACGGAQGKGGGTPTGGEAADAAVTEAPPAPDAEAAQTPPTPPVYPDHQIPKPYGAPPARARLV
jgi:hypothetical protein